MKWVVDASAAAKWLAPERESAQADALLHDELLVPELIFAEVANILWKKQARGEMDAATAAAGVRWLLQLPLFIVGSAELMPAALALAMRLNHPAYDCFYLALAAANDCALVTADKRLHDRCHEADASDLRRHVAWLPAMPAWRSGSGL